MARYFSVAILALLVAGAFAQRTPSPSPKPSPSPSPAAEPVAEPAAEPAADDAPTPAAKPAVDAEETKLTPAATAAIDDAIARAKPTLRGRDAQRVLDNMKAPLTKVAEAKAAGVPVQIAVARSVTDVQQKVPLNPQSRQAVLDAAYRVYTASPATLLTPSPSPSPEPMNVTANATEPMDAMNATMTDDMNMTAGNITDADMGANDTMTEEPTMPAMDNATDLNATRGGAADNATAAPPAPAPAPAPKSSSSMSFVSSGLLALLAAVVVALV